MVKPGLIKATNIMPTDPPPEWEAQKPNHPAQERLLEVMRQKRTCKMVVDVFNGIPISYTVIDPKATRIA